MKKDRIGIGIGRSKALSKCRIGLFGIGFESKDAKRGNRQK